MKNNKVTIEVSKLERDKIYYCNLNFYDYYGTSTYVFRFIII